MKEKLLLCVLFFLYALFVAIGLPMCLVGIRGYIWSDKYATISEEWSVYKRWVKEEWDYFFPKR